jgi:hypothetical protein
VVNDNLVKKTFAFVAIANIGKIGAAAIPWTHKGRID